ncbi:MAG: glycosyltransferase family 4 protein [Candidatus Zhuqueibacterota bacterium]
MNILILTNMFPPIRTGSSHYAADLAKVLFESGNKVIVVTVKLKNYDPKVDAKFPFDVYRLPNIHLKFKALFDFFTVTSINLFNYIRVYRLIRRNQIQVIHQVSHYLDTAILARIISMICRIPFVVSIHTQLDFEKKIYKSILNFIDRIICGEFILRNSEKIISLDNEIIRYINNTYREKGIDNKCVIVPHGIEINNHHFAIKKNYQLSNLIVSVGHVINLRNRLDLIRAMKIIKKEFKEIKLEIIGRIYYLKTQELIDELNLNDYVILRGELSHEETLKRLMTADMNAVWITGQYVGMGTAISESMLCGIPVVNNSPEELLGTDKLKNFENIVLVNNNSIDDIAEKIIWLLKNDERREQIGKAGRDFILEHMDIKKTKDMLLDIYSSVQRN